MTSWLNLTFRFSQVADSEQKRTYYTLIVSLSSELSGLHVGSISWYWKACPPLSGVLIWPRHHVPSKASIRTKSGTPWPFLNALSICAEVGWRRECQKRVASQYSRNTSTCVGSLSYTIPNNFVFQISRCGSLVEVHILR